jgi:histidinol-phosphate aminotransferase
LLEPKPIAKALGYQSIQVPVAVRLNTNESPYAPPESWQKRFTAEVTNLELNRYPDRDCTSLRAKLADYHQVNPENIWCANGSNEVLLLLLSAYGGASRKAAFYEPSYLMHFYISKITDTQVISLERNSSFKVSADQVLTEQEKNKFDILFLCSPNNPTGNTEDKDQVTAICRRFNGLVIIDEAYVEFSSFSFESLIHEFDNVAIIRTFSKTWAMAGLRLGYVIANKEIINHLKAVTLPYNVSSVTQVGGLLALDYENEMKQRVNLIIQERQRVINTLKELGSLYVWDSEANFYLIKPTTIVASELHEKLLEHSVLVRDVSSYKNLENCLRVTVGTRAENDRFLDALNKILK